MGGERRGKILRKIKSREKNAHFLKSLTFRLFPVLCYYGLASPAPWGLSIHYPCNGYRLHDLCGGFFLSVRESLFPSLLLWCPLPPTAPHLLNLLVVVILSIQTKKGRNCQQMSCFPALSCYSLSIVSGHEPACLCFRLSRCTACLRISVMLQPSAMAALLKS